MITYLKVIAKTPLGDTQEYSFMGDMDSDSEIERFLNFMIFCCDDCADRYDCPDEWDADEWHSKTLATWKVIGTDEPPVLSSIREDFKKMFAEVL